MLHNSIISYHNLTEQETLDHLATNQNTGLTEKEVKLRLEIHGANTITTKNRFNYLQTIFQSLTTPLSIILVVAMVISLFLGQSVDSFVILVVLILNSSIETYHAKSAHKNIDLLKTSVVYETTVLRNGVIQKINTQYIVPGDIVLLQEGDHIPADGRIIESHNLKINESTLTGEAEAVSKNHNKIHGTHQIIDQINMAWFGTTTTTGTAKIAITTTGEKTQFGILNQELNNTDRDSNPFIDRIHALSKTIGIGGVILTLLIFSIQFFVLGNPFLEILLISLAILVSIIPESLPTIINITLAQGAKNLAKNNAVVKELSTIESIGSTSVLLTDKTGTITENSMKVEKIRSADGIECSITGFGWSSSGMFLHKEKKYNPISNRFLDTILTTSLVSNRSRVYQEENETIVIGEPTEAALLVMAQKDQRIQKEIISEYEIVKPTEFLSEHKLLATIVQHKKNKKVLLMLTGAPEAIWGKSQTVPEIEKEQTSIYAQEGLRTIAFAEMEINNPSIDISKINQATYLGFVGIKDPVRAEVAETITKAHHAGIRVIMITGDHIKTASAIGKEIGITTKKQPFAIEGEVFLSQSEEDKLQTLATTNIFARITPKTKLEIVKMLQKQKEVVTMIGDGVNDTLALKKSEVGVSMGYAGTDTARAASSIVLTDNNFDTIIQAIFRGRHIFKNIQDLTNFLLSTNASEALLIIIASTIGMPLPLVVTQILLINLVTDGVGSLPFAFREEEIHSTQKRKSSKLLSKYDYGIIISAALGMTAAALFGFIHFLPKGLPYAQTLVFIILALTQIGRLVSLHSISSISELLQHKWLWWCVGVSLVIIGFVLYVPILQTAFSFIQPRSFDILIAFILSLTPLVTITLFKLLYKK